MTEKTNELLRMLIELTARTTHPEEKLRKLVGNHLSAYNMCDGTRTQTDIVRSLKLDQGNFSRTITQWMEAGIVSRLGGPKGQLLHVYPLSKATPKPRKRGQK